MLADPGCRSKVWEAPDRAISESGKNRSHIVAHRELQSATAFNHRKNRCDPRTRRTEDRSNGAWYNFGYPFGLACFFGGSGNRAAPRRAVKSGTPHGGAGQ
jgi:hypothetical protein